MGKEIQTQDSIDQLDMAAGALLNAFRMAFAGAGTTDRGVAVSHLVGATSALRNQGNSEAAELLEEWVEDLSVV